MLEVKQSGMVLVILFSVLIVLSAESPLLVWGGVELSSFFFVPFLLKGNGIFNLSSCWKYFIVQGLGSILFLIYVFSETGVGKVSLLASGVIKLGCFPSFSWVLSVSENLSFSSLFLLSSIQKLPMIIVLSKSLVLDWVFLIGFINLFFSLFFSFHPSSIRWIFAFSSSFNLSWMMISICVSEKSFLFFFLSYFSFLGSIFSLLSLKGPTHFSSICMKQSSWGKIVSGVGLSFLMGCSPFGVFLPKIEIIGGLCKEGVLIPGTLLVFCSCLMIVMYLKLLSLFTNLEASKGGSSLFNSLWGLHFFWVGGVQLLFFSLLYFH